MPVPATHLDYPTIRPLVKQETAIGRRGRCGLQYNQRVDIGDGRLVIITGMSGAGKTAALRCFEDLGYCCLDNLPPSLIETFVQLYRQTPQAAGSIGIVCDVRSGELFSRFREAIGQLAGGGLRPEVLFLDCEDDVLVTRFKTARRLPPMAAGVGLKDAIVRERERLDPLKELAAVVIDTSSLTPRQLTECLLGIYAGDQGAPQLTVTVLSFGYKFGMPVDADFVFDTRFLPNPYYEDQLRPLTGSDPAVRDYVLERDGARPFIDAGVQALGVALPRYAQVHKFSAIVAFGCTGGKHRSVAVANAVAARLAALDYHVVVQHRDIERL